MNGTYKTGKTTLSDLTQSPKYKHPCGFSSMWILASKLVFVCFMWNPGRSQEMRKGNLGKRTLSRSGRLYVKRN